MEENENTVEELTVEDEDINDTEEFQELLSSIKECGQSFKTVVKNIFNMCSKVVLLIIVIAVVVITSITVIPFMLERETFNIFTIFGR